MVIVGVKDGAGVKKLIKKYAVMLNSLLSVICFLPSVDSSENLTDDEDKTAITNSISLTYPSNNNGTSNEESTPPAEIASYVVGSLCGILTLILGGLTFYFTHYKPRQEKESKSKESKPEVSKQEESNQKGRKVYVTYDIGHQFKYQVTFT